MTEQGYKLAAWLHEHGDGMLIALAYFALFLATIITIEVSSTATRSSDEQVRHYFDTDHALTYRR